MTPLLVFYWSVIVSLSVVFIGVSGLALYCAIWTDVTPTTPLTGRVLFHYGRGLVLFTVVVAALGIVGALVSIAFSLVRLAGLPLS